MLLVQEYLMYHSFGELAKEHGVYASFSKSGHKFSLNYDQIEAKETNPLAQECRGLVLACEDGAVVVGQEVNGRLNYDYIVPRETRILAFPMRRFFNYGQGCAAEINWSDPKLAVLEKLDGTLCIVYYDPFTSQWCVATRSVPEADLTMDNGIFTFRTLFEKALFDTCGKSFSDFTNGLNKRITYCFELTTPYNRIVVNYTDCRVTLLAARQLYGDFSEFDLANLGGGLRWVDYDNLTAEVKEQLTALGHDKNDTPEAFVPVPFHLDGVPIVQTHKFSTIPELLDWVSSLNPIDHEGVVVKQGENRIKVKNASYVAYSKCRDTLGTSARNCLEMVLLEKDDDVIPFLPEEIVKNLQRIKIGLQIIIRNYDLAYQAAVATTTPGNKKEFAIFVTKDKSLWSAPFFQMYDQKASNMKDFILKNKKDGTWGDGFLDKLLSMIE